MLLSLKNNIERILGGLAILVLSGLLIKQTIDERHWHKQSDQYEKLYRGEKSAHLQTQLNYRTAAEEARKADEANAKRVLREQVAINKETADEYEVRLADARARYERLQRERGQTPANPSGPGAAPVPSVPPATGESAESALQDKLLATEQAIQLDELIKWVRRQHEVKVSE